MVSDLKGASILLVEDNKTNQIIARTMLSKLGCEVRVVDNGQDAVDATAQHGYQVVLMDVQMPVLDGLQATRAIRERERQTQAPRQCIIAMTADVRGESVRDCLEAGMDDFISKPVTQQALAKTIGKWIH